MSVFCECCMLSGRGLCDGPITRPENSYRMLCVWLCDLKISSIISHQGPHWVSAPHEVEGEDFKSSRIY